MKNLITFLSLSLITLYASNALSSSDEEYSNSVYNQAVSLLDAGKGMESLRGSTNVDENLQCNTTMRSNIVKAESLSSAAETLAVADFQLRLATIELHSCVTCATDALESCGRADEALNKFANGS